MSIAPVLDVGRRTSLSMATDNPNLAANAAAAATAADSTPPSLHHTHSNLTARDLGYTRVQHRPVSSCTTTQQYQ